jgi:hypothetical protein
MKAKEWLETMQQAEDYNPHLTPLIIKYGEMLLSEKDDNILLEALNEIRELSRSYVYEGGPICFNEILGIIALATTKYNQSPSDESNQDELWIQIWNIIISEFTDKMGTIGELKSQYKITKR